MRNFYQKAIFAITLGIFATPAWSATVSRDFQGNDCSGYFGQGFDACTIFIGTNADRIELSPVIAKYDVDDNGTVVQTETNTTLFPEIDGSEFSFTGGSIGTWSYTPALDDPGVRYWAAKGGNGFTLYWEVDDAAVASGGVCDVSDPYTLACLSEALFVTSGDYATPVGGNGNNKGLSHITFYDSENPVVVPVPAAIWLMGSGLLGLAAFSRRKSS